MINIRTKNFLRNMKVTIIFYIVNIFITFISRSVFIKVLGANIAGLNSLYISIIGFLNVAELGIGVAIGYSLYLPLSKNDFSKISDIMALFKYYYKNISKIIILLGIIISLFLPFLIKDQINIFYAYIYYYMYLITCAVSYIFTYKQTLIIADQKQYKIAVVLNFTKITKIVFQCIILMLINSFLVWLVIEFIFNLLGMILANKKIDYEYNKYNIFHNKKDLECIKKENINIRKNIKNTFFHKIGSFVVFQTDAILISFFSTLKETGIYANYMMIINALIGLISTSMNSIMPSIGNLIVEESREKTYRIFKVLYLFDHILALLVCIITYNIVNQFIIFWVGKEYLFNKYCVIALVINLYIQISRGTIDRFKDGFGIYWDINAPILESLINLIMSIILALNFGIIGIFIGTIISNIIIVEIWKPYILFKEGFKLNIYNYINQFILIVIRNILIVFLVNKVYAKLTCLVEINNSFLSLLINGLSITLISITLILVIYSFDKDFLYILKKIKNELIVKIK